MIAIGAYLRTMREANSLTRAEVAARVNTSDQQLLRIEAGEIDTRGSLLLRLVDAVHGNADDLKYIVVNNLTTAEEGRKLALEWYEEWKGPTIKLALMRDDGSIEPVEFGVYDYFDALDNDTMLNYIQLTAGYVRQRLSEAGLKQTHRRGLWRRRRQPLKLPVPSEEILESSQPTHDQGKAPEESIPISRK